MQIDGLVGSNGVLPIGPLLDWVRTQTGAGRYWALPTLSWISPSDAALHVQCAAGTGASLLLLAGLAPAWSAAAAWLLYLSLSVAGQTFLEFQWDFLLTEAGLLAVFLAPLSRLRLRSGLFSPRLARFLLVWLLFRLMLSSGVVKLASGDAAWRSLTALRVHYETQPLPPWTAWFMHQLPASFQTVSCLVLFFVELAGALSLLRSAPPAPLRLRHDDPSAGDRRRHGQLRLLQPADDLARGASPRRRAPSRRAGGRPRRRPPVEGGWPRWILVPAAVVLLAASAVPFLASLGLRGAIPRPLIAVYRAIAPLRSANGYGLFAVMTTARPEIVLEGSEDGATWRPYEFRWKPGDPLRRPRFVAPHQPRLDWQMWFAALGDYRANPWLTSVMARLREGSPEVLGLLATNPFPERAAALRPRGPLRLPLHERRGAPPDRRLVEAGAPRPLRAGPGRPLSTRFTMMGGRAAPPDRLLMLTNEQFDRNPAPDAVTIARRLILLLAVPLLVLLVLGLISLQGCRGSKSAAVFSPTTRSRAWRRSATCRALSRSCVSTPAVICSSRTRRGGAGPARFSTPTKRSWPACSACTRIGSSRTTGNGGSWTSTGK